MTLVAINAVVDVAAHALMVLIRGRLSVAIRALEDYVVTGIGVARRTHSIRTPVVGGEPGVVEGCACPPGYHLMTGLAGGWESSRNVVRVVGRLVLSLVTRIAIAGNCGVVVVHVAACARDFRVRAHQGESCVVVVKRGRLPGGRAVAHIALLRKPARDVIGIGGGLIVRQVAADTRRRREIVVSVLVAIRALQLQVPTRQGEAALGMIERGRLPGGGAMANRAVGRKSARGMIRIGGRLIVVHMTRRAGRAG